MVGDMVFGQFFRSHVSCQIARQADTLCVLCVAAVETPTRPARQRRLHFLGVSEYTPGHTSKYIASLPVRAIFFVLDSRDSPNGRGLASA